MSHRVLSKALHLTLNDGLKGPNCLYKLVQTVWAFQTIALLVLVSTGTIHGMSNLNACARLPIAGC